MLDHFRIVKVGDGQLPPRPDRRPATSCKEENDRSCKPRPASRAALDAEPYAFYLSAWDEEKYIIAQANARHRRGRQLRQRPRHRARRRRLRHRRAANASTTWTSARSSSCRWPRRSSRSSRTTTPTARSWARTCSARPCRCSAPTRRSSAPAWRAIVAQDSGAVVLCKRGGIVDSVDAERIIVRVEARGPGDRRDQGLRRRHLPAHQVPALEPEHLHHPEADRPRGAAGQARATSWPTAPAPTPASWPSAATSWSPSCRGAATTSRTPS